eukprot:312323-Pleurochrysis_carterae.AAC.1
MANCHWSKGPSSGSGVPLMNGRASSAAMRSVSCISESSRLTKRPCAAESSPFAAMTILEIECRMWARA